jgi:hypothetical protein
LIIRAYADVAPAFEVGKCLNGAAQVRQRQSLLLNRAQMSSFSMADRDPTLVVDKNGQGILSNGMDQQEADDKHQRAGYAMN